MKVVTMIENNPITGVKYGSIDYPEAVMEINNQNAARLYQKAKTKNLKALNRRAENTKHK